MDQVRSAEETLCFSLPLPLPLRKFEPQEISPFTTTTRCIETNKRRRGHEKERGRKSIQHQNMPTNSSTYLSPSQRETLSQFESITARKDERSSLELLDRVGWNLEVSTLLSLRRGAQEKTTRASP